MTFRLMTATIAAAALAASGVIVRAESLPCEVGAVQAKAPAGTTITEAAMVEAEGRVRATARWTGMRRPPATR